MAVNAEVIQRCLQGHKEAFQDIVEEYKGYIFAIILNFVSDRDEAENLAQEIFLQIYRSLPQYSKGNFKSWIGKIAVNKSIDYKRSMNKRVREVSLTESVDAKYDAIVDNSDSRPEDMFLKKEQCLQVRKVCDRLPKVYGNTIIKYYLEEKSYKEIALEEEVAVKTIESRLYRAKKLFRANWGEKT